MTARSPSFDALLELLGVSIEDARFSFLPRAPSDIFLDGSYRGIWWSADEPGLDLAFALKGGLDTISLTLSSVNGLSTWQGAIPFGAEEGLSGAIRELGPAHVTGAGDFEYVCDASAWKISEGAWLVLYSLDGEPIGLEYCRPFGFKPEAVT
jgi:hypothetical protein